jgi:serine/threonine protein kinase
LSPSNVLIGAFGDVKVADFGIARATSGTDATTGNSIRGTLAYMSPEQASGLSVDARSDLFAVGSLLYEMLSGSPVYEDADPRLALFRARAAEIRGLDHLCPSLDRDIVEIVERALAASPSDRLPTAQVMRLEIERVAERTVGLATRNEVSAWVERVPRPGRPALLPKADTFARRLPLGVGLLALAGATLMLSWPRRAPAESTVAGQPTPSTPIAPLQLSDLPLVAPAPTDDDAARTPRPALNVPAYGSIDVGSEPVFAYVTIDGRPQGSTPLFGHKVAAGRHYVTVSRPELGSKKFVVDVKPGAHVAKVARFP